MADENVVSLEEHNKIVGLHNSTKADMEKFKKENEELRRKIDEISKKDDINSLKDEWKKEQEETKKQMEELKKKVDETKVVKGVIQDKQISTENQVDIKAELDKHLPLREKNPEKFASHIQRYGYYKNATTKNYTKEQLGMALSLHAGALRTNRDLLPPRARSSHTPDLVLNKQ